MAEQGWYHPDRGYWQTISEPSEAMREAYPEGTVEVALPPGTNYEPSVVDGVFTWLAKPEVSPVPLVVDASQIRLALRQRDELEATVAWAATDPSLSIWWQYSPTVKRADVRWDAWMAALAKTAADVDALFRLAETL